MQMNMEKLLAGLFDFQKFEKEPALQSVIDEVEARYFCAELTDDEIDAIADIAVEHLRNLLGFFGERHVSIDEYEGDDGELILDVTDGDLAVLIGIPALGIAQHCCEVVLFEFVNRHVVFLLLVPMLQTTSLYHSNHEKWEWLASIR